MPGLARAVLAPIALALLCSVALPHPASSQSLAQTVLAQSKKVKQAQSLTDACHDEHDRMSAADDRDFDAFVQAKVKDPANPTIAELDAILAATKKDFDQRDNALARKQDQCDALAQKGLAARAQLSKACDAFNAASARTRADMALADKLAIELCE